MQTKALIESAFARLSLINQKKNPYLNAMLHPQIQQETQRQLAAVTAPYALWVVPLLIENNLCSRANRILVVDVSEETQLRRILARDGGDRQQAEKILAAQASRAQRLACADDIIMNDASPEALMPKVEQLHHSYLILANEFNR